MKGGGENENQRIKLKKSRQRGLWMLESRVELEWMVAGIRVLEWSFWGSQFHRCLLYIIIYCTQKVKIRGMPCQARPMHC